MNTGDMELKRRVGLQKVLNAIKLHGGMTLLSAGITSMVPGITTAAAVAAGVKMFEISHNGVALLQGLHGVINRAESRKYSYALPMSEMAKQVRGTRDCVPDDVFLSVGAPGLWTHTVPTPFLDEHALLLSYSGADGLHVHKTTVEDYHQIAELAHKYGMLIDAYISFPPTDLNCHSSPYSGVSAATPQEVEARVKELEDAGADMIGVLTGRTYQGLNSGLLSPEMEDRVRALVSTAHVPTIVEGGITPDNAPACRPLGAKIVIIGTTFDDLTRAAIQGWVRKTLEI